MRPHGAQLRSQAFRFLLSHLQQTLVLTLLGCGSPAQPADPAQRPKPAAHVTAGPSADRGVGLVFEKPNPYLSKLNAQRAKWEALGLKSYAFVLDRRDMFSSRTDQQVRIVVRDGRVESAHSLLYGGEASVGRRKTMDQVFDDLDYTVTFGEGHVPARFEAIYDEKRAFPRSVSADGRLEIADDESLMSVICFSESPEGCMAAFLTAKQCRAAQGKVVAVSAECRGGVGSIGLVSNQRMCCREYTGPGQDNITAEQCHGAGGSETACEAGMTSIGGSAERGANCCRVFVVE